jgi:hypothetical protein
MGTRERRARSIEGDQLLSSLFKESSADSHEVAIAAVGGFGRGELSPGSDLDIVIIHTGSIAESELSALVNRILYPLWNKNVKIDHSVRTRSEMRTAASSDLKVAMGLLDIRYICGNADLVAAVEVDALESWRKNSRKFLPQLEASLTERHQRMGELAYLLEPDIKEARGGLRDITALRAIATSSAISVPIGRVSIAESTLANVREALHIASGRDKDKLLFQEQDKVAQVLGFADADVLMSEVAQAARSVDYVLDSTWYRLAHKGRDSTNRFFKRTRTTTLSRDITISQGEVVISAETDFDLDPVIGLRAAASAAQLGLPLSMDSLSQLSQNLNQGIGNLPVPWPRDARENLISLIGAGSAMVQIFEALDQEEIIFAWIPEWRAVRSLPQRNVLHRHTVDRHMVETAVHAAALTRQAGVERTVRELGIGFCFAPVFHPAMRFAAAARKELATSTVFNILGPLANPARPAAVAIGVANDQMHLVMAQVLSEKGCDGFIFRGDDGLDEITLATTTSILTIGKTDITSDRIDAKDFGLDNAPLAAIVGGDAQENARISRAIFAGERGAPRDAVLLNAAAAIAAFEGDFESDIKSRLTAGLKRATQAVDSGAASQLLSRWVELTQEISPA